MSDAILLILDYGIQVDVFDTSENVGLYIWIGLLKFRDKFLGLKSLAGGCSVLMTGSAGIREVACTLKKMKLVIVSPGAYISLSNQIHRSDKRS